MGSGYIFLDGYIGQAIGEAHVQEALPFMNDLVMVFYVVSFLGYLFSTIMTVVILLCVGEVQSEMGCHVFLKNIGFMSRLPYLCFLAAQWYPFAFISSSTFPHKATNPQKGTLIKNVTAGATKLRPETLNPMPRLSGWLPFCASMSYPLSGDRENTWRPPQGLPHKVLWV